jgi:transposase InsO family protein
MMIFRISIGIILSSTYCFSSTISSFAILYGVAVVLTAFYQTVGRKHPQEGLIVHTDRGSQYTVTALSVIASTVWL